MNETELRVEALRLAQANAHQESPDATVERAALYLEFLTGRGPMPVLLAA